MTPDGPAAYRAPGYTGRQLERILAVLLTQHRDRPWWCESARQGDADDDARGIDVWVTTPFGEVPLQVKGGVQAVRAARRHLQRYPTIPVIAVDPAWSDARLVRETTTVMAFAVVAAGVAALRELGHRHRRRLVVRAVVLRRAGAVNAVRRLLNETVGEAPSLE